MPSIEVELKYEMEQGGARLVDSYWHIIIDNPNPLRKPLVMGMTDDPSADIPVTPVRSYDSAMSQLRDHCRKTFDDWWDRKKSAEQVMHVNRP
jgi:hypothetical protein